MSDNSQKSEDVPEKEEEFINYDDYSKEIQKSYQDREKKLCENQRFNILKNLSIQTKNDKKSSYFSQINNIFLSLWGNDCSVWQKIVSLFCFLLFWTGVILLLFFFLWVLKNFNLL